MRSSHIFLLSLLCLLVSTPLKAEPSLVRDLAPGRAPTTFFGIGWATIDGDVLYFVASDPAHGAELWRSDGTPVGTVRLTDVCAGPCGSGIEAIGVLHGEVFFSADDGFSGTELWASAGTPGSERRVRDLCPGPCGSQIRGLQAAGGRLFFFVGPGAEPTLWTTDGTRRGTVPLRAIPGDPLVLQALGDLVLFWAGQDVWRSDGTPEGTGRLRDFAAGLPDALSPVLVGGGDEAGEVAYFWTDDALWRTDGTGAGTRKLRGEEEIGVDFAPLTGRGASFWNGLLFLILDDGSLVRTDGTPAGTLKIGEVPVSFYWMQMVPLPDTLLITWEWPARIWRTEGTPETTRPVVELPGTRGDTVGVRGDQFLFFLRGKGEPELWTTDGTAEGTHPYAGDPIGVGAFQVGDLFYYPRDGALWRTDGTAAGTLQLHDFADLPASGGPLEQIAWRGKLLLTAKTAETAETEAAGLFLSDGTAAGTRQIADGLAQGLVRAGERVFFEKFDWPSGPYPVSEGLWTTDGTAAGTAPVRRNVNFISHPHAAGGTLFFSAARAYSYYGDPDLELFRSDGTPEGTGLVENINNFGADTGHHHICYNAPSLPGEGIELAGRLLFVADDGLRGRELWISNGRRGGTSLLADIDPRRLPGAPPSACDDRRQRTGLGSDPAGFVRLRHGVLFAASEGEAGRELWWTDGTTAGTRRVKDLRPGAEGSAPHDLVLYQRNVWFVAATDGGGEALWRSDGTPEGTVLVHPLTMRGLPSWARSLTVAGGRLFFVLFNEASGPELWVTGGSAASTHRVADIRPGPDGSSPQSLTAVGGLLVFAADDGVHGLEPWRSDGTAAGTVPLGDINPGPDASAPGPFTPVAGLVLTGADDGTHGRELWSIPIGE